MSRKSEPVRHTCPDIDRIISTIKSICTQMGSLSEDDEKSMFIESISEWKSELQSIGVGSLCDLEDLRTANASLREWGNEMYNNAERLENEVYDLQQRCDELSDKIDELNDALAELE